MSDATKTSELSNKHTNIKAALQTLCLTTRGCFWELHLKWRPPHLTSAATIITTPCLHMPKEGCPYNPMFILLNYFLWQHSSEMPHIFVIKAMAQKYVRYVEREWEHKRGREGSLMRYAVNPAEVYKNLQLICLDLISQDVLLSCLNLHCRGLPPH